MATSSFMPGEWDMFGNSGGGNLFKLFGGGGGGFSPYSSLTNFGSGFIQNQLGIQQNMLGNVGGMVGSIWGPLGSAAGSILGNLAGGLFGMNKKPPRARANFIYEFSTGNARQQGSERAYEGKSLNQIGQLTDYVGDTAKSILGALGIDPSISKFGFGAFKGRTGFALDTDPWVRNARNPGAYNSIGNERRMMRGETNDLAREMGRVFGQSGARTDVPQSENFMRAAQSALNSILQESFTKAGLSEDEWKGKLEGLFSNGAFPFPGGGQSGTMNPVFGTRSRYQPQIFGTTRVPQTNTIPRLDPRFLAQLGAF